MITDLVFPDGTGFDVLSRLGGSNRVVALALSGLASKQDQQRSLEAGFREHLVKPLDLPLLLAAINRVAVFTKHEENED